MVENIHRITWRIIWSYDRQTKKSLNRRRNNCRFHESRSKKTGADRGANMEARTEWSAHAAVLPVSPLLLCRLFSFTSLSVTTVPFSSHCIRILKRVCLSSMCTLINYYFAALCWIAFLKAAVRTDIRLYKGNTKGREKQKIYVLSALCAHVQIQILRTFCQLMIARVKVPRLSV